MNPVKRRENGATHVAAESSFDIVSKVDRQEVDNALNQAAKEVRQRFDFKNTDASIRWSGQAIEMEANSEERVKAVLDVFQSKLIRRALQDHSQHEGGHQPGECKEGLQADPRPGTEGRESADPGRRAPC